MNLKFKAIEKGDYSLDYIKQRLWIDQRRENLVKRLSKEYDYQNKRVIPEDAQLKEGETEQNVIRQFRSSIDKQLDSNQTIEEQHSYDPLD